MATTFHTLDDANRHPVADIIGRLVDNRDGTYQELGYSYPAGILLLDRTTNPARVRACYSTVAAALAAYARDTESWTARQSERRCFYCGQWEGTTSDCRPFSVTHMFVTA